MYGDAEYIDADIPDVEQGFDLFGDTIIRPTSVGFFDSFDPIAPSISPEYSTLIDDPSSSPDKLPSSDASYRADSASPVDSPPVSSSAYFQPPLNTADVLFPGSLVVIKSEPSDVPMATLSTHNYADKPCRKRPCVSAPPASVPPAGIIRPLPQAASVVRSSSRDVPVIASSVTPPQVSPAPVKVEPKREPRQTGVVSAELLQKFLDSPGEITREQLLGLNTAEVRELLEHLGGRNDLTQEQQHLFKKIRRLVKNRESAQLSRQRKRDYIEKLETHISEMQKSYTVAQDELNKARQSATAAAQQNGILMSYIKTLKDKLYQAGIPAPECPAVSAVQGGATMVDRDVVAAPMPPQNKSFRTAGMCFLIILFSVGILFSTSKSEDPAYTTAPADGQRGRVYQDASMLPVGQNRRLLEKQGEEVVGRGESSGAVVARTATVPDGVQRNLFAQEEDMESPRWYPREDIPYLLCKDVARFDPMQNVEDGPDGSRHFGFLLPKNIMANAQSPAALKPEDDGLVEFTCNISNVQSLPRNIVYGKQLGK